ncbi:sulfotransferase 1C2A-like [Glandiceps talaboti]
MGGGISKEQLLPGREFEVNGVQFCNLFNRSVLEAPEIVNCHEDDVFVVSYPKSGTTWTIEMVSLLMNGGDVENNSAIFQQTRSPVVEATGENLFWVKWGVYALQKMKPFLPRFLGKDIPDVPIEAFDSMYGLASIEKLARPRCIKSHLPYNFFPSQALEKKCKIIYISRNPKDVAVSYFHHHKNLFWPLHFPGTWNDFYKLYIKGKVNFGSWFDHVLGWWEHKDDDNVLFLKYEDVKKDQREPLRKIAAFLDIELTSDLEDKIIDYSSFTKMKSNPAVNLGPKGHTDADETTFIRKGIIGDWANHYTVAQNREIEKMYEERLKGTGLNFEW